MFSKKIKALALFLMSLMVFYVLPVNCLSDVVSALTDEETTISAEETEVSSDKEVYVLGEDVSKREENVKHFRMSDGSFVAVQYPENVHYLDSDGTYTEYDNTLSLSSLSSGNLTNIQSDNLSAGNLATINGYKANKSDVSVTLANNISQNALTSISKGEYSVSIIPLSLNTSSKVVVNNTASKPTLSSKPTIEEASKLYKHTSSVKYTGLFNGADLEYVLSGSNLKENIIVNEKASSYVYSFNLNLTGLYAVINEDGSISLIGNNTDKIEFTIPKGYMFDANGECSDNVTYSLNAKPNGNYTLTVTADSQWINEEDRAFPVTVDPTIINNGIALTSIGYNYNETSFSTVSSPWLIGEKINFEWVVLAKLNNLPTLPASAYVYEANYELPVETTSGDICVGVYNVVDEWANIVNKASLDDAVDTDLISYVSLESGDLGVKKFNITSLVRGWYNGEENNGICLMGMTAINSNVSFFNSSGAIEGTSPAISIKYTDMNGLEDYWTYSSYPIFDIGTSNINLATGNLSLSLGTLSTTDYLMPYMPVLTYNSIYAGEHNTNGTTTVPYKKSFTGYGFKWSMNETIVEKMYYDRNGNDKTYYIFSDSDGTEHAFTEDENGNKIIDEDGLGLELTVSTSNYTITYPDKTVKTFTKKSEGTYFVSGGVLSSITDKNGNKIKFEVNNYGGVSTIGVYPNGSSTVTSKLRVYYNDNCKVNRILNITTNESYIFYYSSSQTGGTVTTGGSGYLRKIIRAHYSGEASSPDWSGFMSGETTSGFVTDETYLLTYSGKYLKTISDVNADKQYDFTTTNQKTNIVCEKANLSSLTLGQKHTFTYGDGFTEVRTPGTDDIHGNGNDIMTLYTFDCTGRNKTEYSYTADKSEIYGGVGYVYESEEREYSHVDRVKNNLRHSSVAGGNDTNYLLNGSFEKAFSVNSIGADSWILSNATIIEAPNDYVKLPNNSTSGNIKQSVYLAEGSYTLSFEAESAHSSEYFTCKMIASVGSEVLREETFSVSTQKLIQSMTFDVSSNSKVTITISVTSSNSTKNISVDNVMLNSNSTMANFSMVQNGNFENVHYSSDGLTNISPELWTASQGTIRSFASQSPDSRFGRSMKISSVNFGDASASQVVYAGGGISSRYNLLVSGYAYGTNQVLGDNSVFALRVKVSYDMSEPRNFYVHFHPNVENQWQFSSQIIECYLKDNSITKIEIFCDYSYQEGVAYFDNISISKVPDEDDSQVFYYSNNPLSEKYGLVRAIKNGNNVVFYDYDADKNIVLEVKTYDYIPTSNNTITKYKYSNSNLVSEEVYSFTGEFDWRNDDSDNLNRESDVSSKTINTCLELEYNSYGQVTEEKYYQAMIFNGEITIKQGTKPIKTLHQYKTTSGSKIFGALTQTTDTLGNTTKYFYDETNGLLLAEVYPDNTGIAYEYDDKNRLILTVPVTYNADTNTTTVTTNQEKVEYSYNSKGFLNSIKTESTLYEFTYDCWGNSEGVLIGNRTLAEYSYNDNNGKIKSLTYGNGDKVEYVYDLLDRVTQICYTESGGTRETLYEYSYTNEGYLKRFDNNVENTSIVYSYDGAGKLISTVECEQGETDEYYFVNYSYDNLNRLDEVSSVITDDASNANYNLVFGNDYDSKGRIEKVSYLGNSFSGHIDVSLVYDNIDRVNSKTVSFSGFSQIVSYTYEEGYKDTTSTTDDTTSARVKTYNSTIGNNTTSYTYNYDDAGYITEVRSGNKMVADYEYDSQGQLTIFYRQGTIYGYTYDNAGNITYRYEDSAYWDNGTYITDFNEYTYTYGDSQWGDLLTAFNGNTITYDGVGNPLQYYNGNVFTWKQGRRLSTVSKNGSVVASYDYDENGIRTSKTTADSSYKYILNGSQIVAETWDDCINIYLYDENGSPIGFLHRYANMAEDTYNTYFYEKNMFGDILAIYDQNGVKQVSYSYDAFGKSTQTIHVADTRAWINHLRYRGYYYDKETGFYYLNSRYYDPVTCRFINADSPFITTATPWGLTDKNLFAYCDNNPVMREDEDGEFWDIVLDIGFLVWSIVDVVNEPDDLKNWAALAVDIAFAVVPFVPSGAGQVIKAGNKIDNALDVANAINKVDNIQDISKVTMIGRDMNRVTNTANLFGKSDNLYKVWKEYDNTATGIKKFVHNGISMAHNGGWLFGKLRQGYTVIDIGVTTSCRGLKTFGLWYGTERFVLGMWRSRNIWKLPVNCYL